EKKNPQKNRRGVFSKKGGANSNQAHLGLPEASSRRLLLLEEATLLAWASWAATSSPILL
ncbi:hypothetical protein, partial [Psychrobacter sp. NG27]|uniref:hypothetical protein n=1 Tax=Psychrobacter sp. NG27 TaxID=2781966 RepID=UPI001D12EA79